MGIIDTTKQKINEITQSIPKEIWQMFIMIFIFMVGWGLGPDIFLGIYMEQIIPYVRVVGVLGAILSGIKLLLCIPIGYLGDEIQENTLLIIGKILYTISALCNFAAGFFHMPVLLVIGIIFNGLANPIFFTTSYVIIRKKTTTEEAAKVFSLFNSFLRGGCVVGALLIANIANTLPIQYMFLFVAVGSIITIPRKKKEHTTGDELEKLADNILHGTHIYKKVRENIRQYDKTMYITLILQIIYGLINNVTVLFVPIIAGIHNMSLSQIALLFAISHAPKIASYGLSNIRNKYNKFIISCTALIITGLLLGLFAITTHFAILMIIMFIIGILLATVNPLISGFISSITEVRHMADITGVQEFCTRAGEIIGSLIMAIAIAIKGMESGFITIALIISIMSFVLLTMYKQFTLPHVSRTTKEKIYILNIAEKIYQKVFRKIES